MKILTLIISINCILCLPSLMAQERIFTSPPKNYVPKEGDYFVDGAVNKFAGTWVNDNGINLFELNLEKEKGEVMGMNYDRLKGSHFYSYRNDTIPNSYSNKDEFTLVASLKSSEDENIATGFILNHPEPENIVILDAGWHEVILTYINESKLLFEYKCRGEEGYNTIHITDSKVFYENRQELSEYKLDLPSKIILKRVSE